MWRSYRSPTNVNNLYNIETPGYGSSWFVLRAEVHSPFNPSLTEDGHIERTLFDGGNATRLSDIREYRHCIQLALHVRPPGSELVKI
jgi:hypothetical protein